MIPVSLRLEDFLSYAGPETLDFTGFDVACLVGPNGQGKSSLLDAMTWALFGAARGCEGGQHQERLIRDGAERACVEFAFELGAERFRVVRRRWRTGRSDLRFEVDGPDGWTTLAGDTTTQTQTRISETLRLDYRTFTASAFLLQGRADDFLTRMRPEDRKEVFARLLDLGVYEKLSELSRVRARDAQRARVQHAERIDELRDVAAGLAECRTELEAASRVAADAAADAARAEQDLRERQAELAKLDAAESAARSMAEAVTDLEDRLAADRAALDDRTRDVAELDSLLARKPEVDGALAEVARLADRDAELQDVARRRSELDVKRTELEGKVAAAEQALTDSVVRADRQADEAQREVEALERSQAVLAEAQERLARLPEVESSLVEVRETIDALRSQHAEADAAAKSVDARREELSERLEVLGRGGGECPVCKGPLDEDHRARLLVETTELAAALAEERKALSARLEEVIKEGKRLREEEKRFLASLSELQDIAQRAAALREKLGRLPDLHSRVRALRAEAAQARGSIEAGRAAPQASAELRRVREAAEALGYDPREHGLLRARLSELAGFAELRGRIEAAAERREQVEAEVRSLSRRIEGASADLESRRGSLREATEALAEAPGLRSRASEATGKASASRDRLARASAAEARLAERLDGLERSAAELERVRTAEREAADTHRRHSRLATAFGRGGIPDLVIENALPELREDANEILGRLTDWEMSVDFVMSGRTKTGKVRETFDVLVGHDGGLRDYSMFSGGEAFRIAFSIRMALSKLLLRRAGARMETLVVDEGFGTQDPEGRERLVEVINLARSEFRKVLVITHLDELKESLGAQLRVHKDPRTGSHVHVDGA